jgi:VanZ family protein
MDTATDMQRKAIGFLCASVLACILIAGLWPFHAPKNEVSWLTSGTGLHFGRYGLILGSKASTLPGLREATSFSLEIMLRPDRTDTGGTLLAFYSREDRVVALSLHQSLDDLLLRRIAVYQQRRVKTKWYIEHAFSANKEVFVTITSSSKGTAVYVNGRLTRTSLRFGLSSNDLTGRLVVGNDPAADNGWQGLLRGLAIYNRELTPAEVLQHYGDWTMNRQDEIKIEVPVALYLCNEGMGNVVHNQMDSGNDLRIPEYYFVLNEPFLQVPWDEFDPSWRYYKNVLINIGGFVPLGFFFCAYFSSVRRLDRAVIATIVFGAVVSFTIEVLQAFLPTRDSGLTDIITNTVGTSIGALLYDREYVRALFATISLGVPKGRLL